MGKQGSKRRVKQLFYTLFLFINSNIKNNNYSIQYISKFAQQIILL